MLFQIYRRLSVSKALDQVVIATTTEASDDLLTDFAQARGIGIQRGSTDNLVERLLDTAKVFQADILVRIWGDCPLIDYRLIESGLEQMQNNQLDFVSTDGPNKKSMFPAGFDFEIYRRETLEKIYTSTTDSFYLEVPYEYIYQPPPKFKTGTVQGPKDLSHLSLCVDYPEDLELIRQIYSELQIKNGILFSLDDVLTCLITHPERFQTSLDLPRNLEYKIQLEHRQRQI